MDMLKDQFPTENKLKIRESDFANRFSVYFQL